MHTVSFNCNTIGAHPLLQKKLDFTLKVVGGDLSSIPGVSGAIEVQTLPQKTAFFPV